MPIILGGDWNATYSTNDVTTNPDILIMAAPPSEVRSRWLEDICLKHKLVDPYRILHSDSEEFTYISKSGNNKSRIDFFLVSEDIIDKVGKCTISASVDTTLFDHKSISITLFGQHNKPKQVISSSILQHDRVDDTI